ncbi:MAG: hypothetical protein GY750_11460 [Lentisphaerae bacterium]|nr:hypothetical protein [Lentisphaerota bacterium]MCP4102031.1 hypothetical protein [Lentisphaerota bacterium]
MRTIAGTAMSSMRSYCKCKDSVSLLDRFKKVYDDICEAIETRVGQYWTESKNRIYAIRVTAAIIFCSALSAVGSVLFNNLSNLNTLVTHLFAYIFPAGSGWIMMLIPAFATLALGIPFTIVQMILLIGIIKRLIDKITGAPGKAYSSLCSLISWYNRMSKSQEYKSYCFSIGITPVPAIKEVYIQDQPISDDYLFAF